MAFVIECKSGAISKEISKDDCAQLLSSSQWFTNKYCSTDRSIDYVPILIHKSYTFANDASPSGNMVIIGEKEMNNIRDAIKNLLRVWQVFPMQQIIQMRFENYYKCII